MAHTHHCDFVNAQGTRCGLVVAICDDSGCQQPTQCDPTTGELTDNGHRCSLHHQDDAHRVEDKPTVRMTVRVVDDKNGRQSDVP